MIPANICVICTHYKGDEKCNAFPKQIPDEIWIGRRDHREPYTNDKGIQYELQKARAQGGEAFRPRFD